MKKGIVIVVWSFLLLFIAIPLFAQQQMDIMDINAKALKRLGFSAGEIKKITKIYEETQKTVMNARAEIDIYRAELKKLLLNPNVDMKEVEKLLKKSLEWELKMRLAQIEREVKIRKLVGDRKWARLVQYFRRLRLKSIEAGRVRIEKQKTRKNIPERKEMKGSREERIRALLKELERLLSEKSGR